MQDRYAKICDVTGAPFNAGFCIFDGHYYFSQEQHVIDWLRERGGTEGLSDDYILNEAYELGEYYWSEWDEDVIDDQGFYYNEKGELINL